MCGMLIIIGSVLVYDMVVVERKIAWKHARMYQKEKSKVGELESKIICLKKENKKNLKAINNGENHWFSPNDYCIISNEL